MCQDGNAAGRSSCPPQASVTGRLPRSLDGDFRERGMKGALASPQCAVLVEPFREAFEKSEMTLTELAVKLGWYLPDRQRVKRTLGLRRGRGENKPMQRFVTEETALKLMEIFSLDPVDVGL